MSNPTVVYNEFPGYTNRIEVTNTPNPSYMVAGSKNVVVDWLNTVSSRQGYKLLGSAGEAGGIQGKYDWRTNRGQYYSFRKFGKTLQVLQKDGDDDVWVTLWDTTGTDEFANKVATMTQIFNDTRKIDELVIGAGNVKFYTWSGALTRIASTTANTIVCTTPLGTAGFPATGNLYINGNSYAYTGITDSTFTGVTADPTGEDDGSFVSEVVVARAISGVPTNFTADFVGAYRNQLYVGSSTSRIVLASNATDYTNFTSSTAVGGARTLTLDDNCAGFEASKKSMVIFGQSESLFEVKTTISADQTKEYYEIERLVTSPRQGLISPQAKLQIRNAVVYVTREKTLDTVEFVQNITDLQSVPISDLVKNDFDSFDFTGASLGYWERNILLAIPASNACMMYDIERKIWQPPIVWSGANISLFSVTEDGRLIGHDAYKNQSYVLFTGVNDGGNPIQSKAVFAYNNFQKRFDQKRLTRFAQDGYISPTGVLTQTLDYDYEGSRVSKTFSFSGNELDYVYAVFDSGGIGKASLGNRTLGGSSLFPAPEQRRFRYADATTPTTFYELRVSYEMETLNGSWRLVGYGCDVQVTNNVINDITRT